MIDILYSFSETLIIASYINIREFKSLSYVCLCCVQRSHSGFGSVAVVWRSCPAAEWVTSSGRNTHMCFLKATPTHTSSKCLKDNL